MAKTREGRKIYQGWKHKKYSNMTKKAQLAQLIISLQ